MALTDQIDPIAFQKQFWPDLKIYKQQREIMYSVWYDSETVVPAGHMLGKDFIAGLITIIFFCTRRPCRIITTSVKDDHLNVLWGEITRFLQTSKFPLLSNRGGPIQFSHHRMRWCDPETGEVEGLSYVRGMVSDREEGFSGHHIAQTGDQIPRTMLITDEASGVQPFVFERGWEWAHRIFIIGNPYDCSNYFHQSVKGKLGTNDKGGDIQRDKDESSELVTLGEGSQAVKVAKCDVRAGGKGYHRRIIKIKAEDSPNVRLGKAQEKLGQKPDNRIIIDGVLPYFEYLKRRDTWDLIKQTVGLDAEFYEGAENLMFPPLWLTNSERVALNLGLARRTRGTAMGVDPAEGGDNTAWAIGDQQGLVFLNSEKTPDTSKVVQKTIELMHAYHIPPQNVCFDRGGGGKQHCDTLRARGYKVRSVHFGESATFQKKRNKKTFLARIDEEEQRTIYKNRRAEMYGRAREVLDPTRGGISSDYSNSPAAIKRLTGSDLSKPSPDHVFGIPEEFYQIRQQLTPIPLLYDGEGVLWLPPKRKKNREDTTETLTDIIGHSPDEADAFVLLVHVLKSKAFRNQPRSMV